MISEDWQSYFGARQCRGGMLWKSQKFQGGQMALMDSMKTVIKASEHLSLNTHVTNLLISLSRNDFIYLLCFGPILIFIQTRPFVILTTFIKVSFIRAPVASVQAADDNCCQELTLLSLQASQVGATLDNREPGSETWGEQAVIIHAIRKGHEASSISKGHTHASICHTQTDRDGGSWGTTVGIKFHIAGWERCLIRSVWIFSC